MARILCVDDDANILTGIKRALALKGHQVFTAQTEDGAIAAVAEHQPDLIICDVMMPERTEGFHVVWRLRQLADEALAAIPVIMATGIHDTTELRFYPDDSQGAVNPADFLPIQGWLDKPYSNEELWAAVDRALGA